MSTDRRKQIEKELEELVAEQNRIRTRDKEINILTSKLISELEDITPLKSGLFRGKNGKAEVWSKGKIIGLQG